MKDILPILTDPSLNLSNLTSAVNSLPDSKWDVFGGLMNVPRSTLEKIRSQFHDDGERKTTLLRVYLTEHPHLTWEHVSDILYRLVGGRHHSVLERLQSMFPTGEYMSVCVIVIPAIQQVISLSLSPSYLPLLTSNSPSSVSAVKMYGRNRTMGGESPWKVYSSYGNQQD